VVSNDCVVAGSRSEAIIDCRRKYAGAPCPRCGKAVRYTSSKSCVACVALRYELGKVGLVLAVLPPAEKVVVAKKTRPPGVASTRGEAIAKGMLYYRGRLCKAGHIVRYAPSKSCVECTRAESVRRRITDPRYLVAIARWEKANPEKVRLKSSAWRSRNRDKVNVFDQNRRARKAGAEGSHTNLEARNILSDQGEMCAYCGSKDHMSLDHKVPLCRGGSNLAENLQWLCKSCNSSKGGKTHEEYMAYLVAGAVEPVTRYG